MAHLIRSKKIDLVTAVIELGLNPPDGANKSQLTELILKFEGYNEDIVKNLLAGITSEREESEKLLQQKEIEDREFQLKKLELKNTQNTQLHNSMSKIAGKGSDVLKLLNRYNNEEEISIYLTLFERQAKRLGIEKNEWVTYLLALLPLDIVSLINRETAYFTKNYCVKRDDCWLLY